MTPGAHPTRVSNRTINIEPHPRSKTASGGKITAKITLKHDMTTT